MGVSRGVEAGLCRAWIGEGFATFKASPLNWVIITVLLIVIQIILGLIPIIGQIAGNIIWPLFIAGIMLGCAALDEGDDLTIGHLFAGFSAKPGPLIGLGAMYLVMLLGVGIVVGILAAISGIGMAGLAGAGGGGMPGGEAVAVGGILMLVLVAMGLFLPVIMAIWFAPALMVLADKGVFESLKLSFVGCLKNIIPFLIYGIIALVLLIIGAIPIGLGWLVVIPLLWGSLYASYRDIYGV